MTPIEIAVIFGCMFVVLIAGFVMGSEVSRQRGFWEGWNAAEEVYKKLLAGRDSEIKSLQKRRMR